MKQNCTAGLEAPSAHIISSEENFVRLAPEWDELYTRADKPYVSQSFEWVRCVWKTLLRSGRLRCIAVRDRNRLVLVWPLVAIPYRRFWTAQMPIATGGDYNDFLVEPSPAALDYARLAWQSRSREADLILLNRVRVSSLLYQVIQPRVKPLQQLPAHYQSWDQCETWNAYYHRLSERRNVERRQRRLSEHGAVSFKVTENAEEIRSLTTWLLQNKAVWLAATGRSSSWVGSANYEEFILSIPAELKRSGHVTAFALLYKEDRPIAVQINIVGTSRIILFHSADDREFRQFSPQHILTVQVMQWAYERNLTVDFCAGPEPFKKTFAPSDDPVEDYRIPDSSFGKIHELVAAAKESGAGAHLNRILRRLRP